MRSLEPLAATNLSLPADSYVYRLSYQSHSNGLAAISSDDSLRIIDPSTLQTLPGGVFSKTHEKGITCLKNGPANSFATAGRDGVVRIWDTKERKKLLELCTIKAEPVSALECAFDVNLLWTGVELDANPPGDAPIYTWDIRSPKEPVMLYADSHNDTITELIYTPSLTCPVLLSGSTDGLINIFDTTQTSEDDALQYTINQKSAIHHARGLSTIIALTTDECLSIHPGYHKIVNSTIPVDDQRVAVHLSDVREQLGCDYIVDLVETGGKVVIVSGSYSNEFLDLVPLEAPADGSLHWTPNMDEKIRINGAHGTEVVRDICIIDAEPAITFTCGEDGHIRSWRLNTENAAIAESPTAKKTKKKHSGKEKESRFKPY